MSFLCYFLSCTCALAVSTVAVMRTAMGHPARSPLEEPELAQQFCSIDRRTVRVALYRLPLWSSRRYLSLCLLSPLRRAERSGEAVGSRLALCCPSVWGSLARPATSPPTDRPHLDRLCLDYPPAHPPIYPPCRFDI
ncbi:hypothetical protein BC827DRAFT_180256 [Russula dissimulans]|nr:hypothetical protein BC827DRAFT_180256 [Russula dissimulans]